MPAFVDTYEAIEDLAEKCAAFPEEIETVTEKFPDEISKLSFAEKGKVTIVIGKALKDAKDCVTALTNELNAVKDDLLDLKGYAGEIATNL